MRIKHTWRGFLERAKRELSINPFKRLSLFFAFMILFLAADEYWVKGYPLEYEDLIRFLESGYLCHEGLMFLCLLLSLLFYILHRLQKLKEPGLKEFKLLKKLQYRDSFLVDLYPHLIPLLSANILPYEFAPWGVLYVVCVSPPRIMKLMNKVLNRAKVYLR